jgi:hypothetical protein
MWLSLRAGRSGIEFRWWWGGGQIFRTRMDRSWGPPSLLYEEYRVIPRGKEGGAWRWQPTPSRPEAKVRVDLHMYSSSGPSWPVMGWTLPSPFTYVACFVCLFVCFLGVTTHCGCFFHSPVAGFSLLVFEVSWSHNDAPQSVGLLWTSDQSVAETSTWEHKTLTTDKHPCSQWDSNRQSQRASGRRPTP